MFIDLFFYTVISYAGYFSTLNHTRNIILERVPLGGKQFDVAILIAVAGIILVLIQAIPVNYLPFRS